MKTSDRNDSAGASSRSSKTNTGKIAGSRSSPKRSAAQLRDLRALPRRREAASRSRSNDGGSGCPPSDVATDLIVGKWLDATGRTDPAYMVPPCAKLTKLILSTAPRPPARADRRVARRRHAHHLGIVIAHPRSCSRPKRSPPSSAARLPARAARHRRGRRPSALRPCGSSAPVERPREGLGRARRGARRPRADGPRREHLNAPGELALDAGGHSSCGPGTRAGTASSVARGRGLGHGEIEGVGGAGASATPRAAPDGLHCGEEGGRLALERADLRQRMQDRRVVTPTMRPIPAC